MWRHRFFRIAEPTTEVRSTNERGNARGYMNDSSAREIQTGESTAQRSIQPSSLAPHHVRHGSVDHQTPKRHKEQHGAEFHPFRKSPGDERWSDNGEHQLIDHKSLSWDAGRVIGVRLHADSMQENV